jgi:iron complex outermembrane receptor protein
VGIKSDLFNRTVRFNLSAFHYDYSNLQVNSVQNGASITLNAAAARINGIDLDLNYVPNNKLNLGAAFSFLDSKFNSFPSGPINFPNPVPPVGTGGNGVRFGDLTGNHTSRAPKFTMSLTATYTVPTESGDFSLNGSLYHNSGFFWEPDNRYSQPSYNLLNTTLSWTSVNKKYEIKVYARNLLNEYYYSYFSESSRGDSGSPEMPRNFGGAITVHL